MDPSDSNDKYQQETRKIELKQKLLEIRSQRLSLEEQKIELELVKMELKQPPPPPPHAPKRSSWIRLSSRDVDRVVRTEEMRKKRNFFVLEDIDEEEEHDDEEEQMSIAEKEIDIQSLKPAAVRSASKRSLAQADTTEFPHDELDDTDDNDDGVDEEEEEEADNYNDEESMTEQDCTTESSKPTTAVRSTPKCSTPKHDIKTIAHDERDDDSTDDDDDYDYQEEIGEESITEPDRKLESTKSTGGASRAAESFNPSDERTNFAHDYKDDDNHGTGGDDENKEVDEVKPKKIIKQGCNLESSKPAVVPSSAERFCPMDSGTNLAHQDDEDEDREEEFITEQGDDKLSEPAAVSSATEKMSLADDTNSALDGTVTKKRSTHVSELAEDSKFGDDDVGYLLLEDCEVVIVDESSLKPLALTTWNDVHVSLQNEKEQEETKETETDETEPNDETGGEVFENGDMVCQRGNLVLQRDEISGALVVKKVPRFDATTNDLSHNKKKCGKSCSSQGNRSDAALTLGLVVSCQQSGHINISSCQIMARRVNGDGGRCGGQTKEAQRSLRYRVALLITFSGLSERDFGVIGKNGRRRKTSRLLPPCTQLLFALLRCDWETLDRQITELKKPINSMDNTTHYYGRDGKLQRQLVSFFPSKLSLEELYPRIRAGSKNRIIQASGDELHQSNSILFTIPSEVVASIATYLRARSLDALRCSCRFLQSSLVSVVPGMKLKLFSHQITSLAWMRQRETLELTESSCQTAFMGKTCFGADAHRAVTGGATVKLIPRSSSKLPFRLDQRYGKRYILEEDEGVASSLARKVARGGLLCDDPGLGKTITVLSLILQTIGLSSESGQKEKLADRELCSDEKILEAYWREEVPQPYQEPSLLKIVHKVLRSDPHSYYFIDPVDPVEDHCPDYYDVIANPICFSTIKKKIAGNEYSRNFKAFEDDVRRCLINALNYNAEDTLIYCAAANMLKCFEKILGEWKEMQLGVAKRAFSNSIAKPNSSVAALVERQARRELLDSMISSAANLLVVPGTLLQHWEEQIDLHIDKRYCTKKEPITFRYTSFDKKSRKRIEELTEQFKECETCFPFLFVDNCPSRPLPDAEFLAKFAIVLTTTQRFTNEWRLGSFEDELRSTDGKVSPYVSFANRRQRGTKRRASPFLKVHWNRMIVDEGHHMGRGKQNSSILFAAWVSAQRRWAMTGTPTPQTVSRSGLVNLLGLMGFLQHGFFTLRQNGEDFWAALSRCWNDGQIASFYRLRSLLEVLMVRHTKLDIDELPRPKFETKLLSLSSAETKAYNTLVCAVQSNLLLTSMKAKVSAEQDSLLHRSQGQHARKALSNIRLSCCGGTRVVPTVEEKLYQETIQLLVMKHKLSDVKLTVIRNYLARAQTEELSSCMLCGIQLSTLLLVPCGDLICTECMTRDTRTCPVCNAEFDSDEFQRLQPGLDYTWHWNLEDAKKKLRAAGAGVQRVDPETPNGDVRHELNLDNPMNPQGQQRHNDLNRGQGQQGGVQQGNNQRRRPRRGDGHVCKYDQMRADGVCTLCHEEHDECVMIRRAASCSVCHRIPEPCPENETKFYHVVSELEALLAEKKSKKRLSAAAANIIGEEIEVKEERPPKVIIFSQFRDILNLVGHRVLRRFGAGAIAEYWGSYRKQELRKFQVERNCFCMLLGKDGSEGLDLSFVTHIFFMEEVWDKSMENQTVARAWRMGATGEVKVQTLVAKSTVEQMMTEIEKKLAGGASDDNSVESSATANDYQRAKLLYLLKSVRLINPEVNRKPIIRKNLKRKDKHKDSGGKKARAKKRPKVGFCV